MSRNAAAPLARLEGVARSWRAHRTQALYREARTAARRVLSACGEPVTEKNLESILNGYGVKLSA